MAGGDIYKALQRNQNLEPTANAIEQYFNARQKKKDLEDFWNLVKQTGQGINKATSPAGNIPNPHFIAGEAGPWSPEIATTQFDPVKANQLVSDMTMNALQKFSGMNPEYINLAASLLEKGIKERTPVYSTKEFDPTKGIEQIRQLPGQAPESKIIREAVPKKNITSLKPNPTTGTYWGIDESGKPSDTKIPYDTYTKDIALERLGLEKNRVGMERERLNRENPKEEQSIDKLLADLKKEKTLSANYEKNLKGYELKKDRALKLSETSANIQGITEQLRSTLSRKYKNFDTDINYLINKGMPEDEAIKVFVKENRKSRK